MKMMSRSWNGRNYWIWRFCKHSNAVKAIIIDLFDHGLLFLSPPSHWFFQQMPFTSIPPTITITTHLYPHPAHKNLHTPLNKCINSYYIHDLEQYKMSFIIRMSLTNACYQLSKKINTYTKSLHVA